MAHIRQSRPESGLGFKTHVLHSFQGIPSSLDSGPGGRRGTLRGIESGLDCLICDCLICDCLICDCIIRDHLICDCLISDCLMRDCLIRDCLI